MFRSHVATATTVVLSLVTVSQSALAQQATVKFPAADLTTPAGQRAIASRIHDAAARACAAAPGAPLAEVVASQGCTTELSNVLVGKVNKLSLGPQLAAIDSTR